MEIVITLTDEFLPGALEVLRDAFFTEEKICNAVKILEDSEEIEQDPRYKCTKGSKELEDLSIDIAKDGVSQICIDKTTKEVLGVAFNKIQVPPENGGSGYFEKFAIENMNDDSSKSLVDFMIQVDAKLDLFKYTNTDCILEVTFLAVKTKHKGKGIGTNLLKSSIEVARKMKNSTVEGMPKPGAVCSMFTSRFSQRCGIKSGFTNVLMLPYTDFVYKGQLYSDTIGPEHPVCCLCVKMLN